jgi:hypothetical protein
MADIAASDVTHTLVGKAEIGRQRKVQIVDVAFGDGSLTYPTGGVPLTLAQLGFKRGIDSIRIVNPSHGDGLIYKPDISNAKIRIYFPTQQTGGAGNRAGVEYSGGSTAVAATTLRLECVGW